MYKVIRCDSSVGADSQYSRVMLAKYDMVVLVGYSVGYYKISDGQALFVYIRGNRQHIRAEGVICAVELRKDFFGG